MLFRVWLLAAAALLPLGAYSTALYALVAFTALPLLFPLLLRALALPTAPATLAANFRNLVVAHRGGQPRSGSGQATFPENSLAAFRWAASKAGKDDAVQQSHGADAIELDVWLSKDGVPMVNHDPTVFRHFEGEGRLDQMTAKELQSLRYRAQPLPIPTLSAPVHASNDPDGEEAPPAAQQTPKSFPTRIDASFVASERMPSLEDVLCFLESEAPNLRCMIEVKERANVGGMVRALAKLYAQRPWMYERCFVASFNPLLLRRLRQADARVVTSYLYLSEWSQFLLAHARANRVVLPRWISHNWPLRWVLDDALWWLGSTRAGLDLLGANMTGVEQKDLCERQIRREAMEGTFTSTWCVNDQAKKEWLLQQGVTVITDVEFRGKGGACKFNPHGKPALLL